MTLVQEEVALNVKIEERKILLRRFFRSAEKLYNIGKFLDLKWFNQFDEELKSKGWLYFDSDKEKEVIDLIADSISDEQLRYIFEKFEPSLWGIDCFRGKHYSFENGVFEIKNRQNEVREAVLEVLGITGERGYAFLKAIINIYEEGKWDSADSGAVFSNIIAKMREIIGEPTMPSPRDYPLFSSYKLYYKTGSNKYPTHTIPMEIIPVVKEALEEWREQRKAKKEEELVPSQRVEKIKSAEQIYCPLIGSECTKYIEPQENMYFVAHTFSKEKIDDLRSAIEGSLEEFHLKPYYADQEIRSRHILCKICEKIRSSRFGIFEISDQNPNVTLELGMAYGSGKNALLIAKKGSEIPADLDGMDRLEYETLKDLTEKLRTKTKEFYIQHGNTTRELTHEESQRRYMNSEIKERKERDVKEMECLVGKLYPKIRDKNIFFKLPPERRNSTGEGVKEHFRFWDKIEQYIYLGSPELRLSLNNYIESKSGTDKEYEKAEADLIKEIKNRYSDLIEEIEISRGK